MEKIAAAKFFAFIAFILLAGCVQPKGPQTGTPSATVAMGQGRVVFTLTDAAADMQAVSSIKVTVDSVRVQSATEGWVTVSSIPRTYDLLQLKASGAQALLADVQMKEGTYNQLRLDISKVVITDASGEKEAKLPSGELKIVGDLVVEANSTSTAAFDFIADESLHVTGKGEYILAPVVQLETRNNAQVEVKTDKDVVLSGGSVKTKVKVGMDLTGKVGAGLKVPADVLLEITPAGLIKIGGVLKAEGKGRAVITIADRAADMGAVSSVKVTVNSVSVQSAGEGWVTLSSTPRTYDLLQLKASGTQALFADVQLKAGTYNQLRLDISNVMVTDASGEKLATLPSGELKIVGTFEVKEGATSTAAFDFIADDSLHITGKGEYVLAPVVQLETREDAEVEVVSESNVQVRGGKVRTNIKVGMDLNGKVNVNAKVPSWADISIDNGVITIEGGALIAP